MRDLILHFVRGAQGLLNHVPAEEKAIIEAEVVATVIAPNVTNVVNHLDPTLFGALKAAVDARAAKEAQPASGQ